MNDGLTPRSKRPVVEMLPALDAGWLRKVGAIPTAWNQRTVINLSLRVSGLRSATCTATQIEIEDSIGDVTAVRLSWDKHIVGGQLYLVCPICNTRRQRALHLYRSRLTCRTCCRALYASQQRGRYCRPRWKATKARAKIGMLGIATLRKPFGMRQKTYSRIRSIIEQGEHRSRKPKHTAPPYKQLSYYDRADI